MGEDGADGAKTWALKLTDRKGLCVMLHGMVQDGGPVRGSFSVAGSLCDVSRQSAARVFKEIRSAVSNHDNENDTNCINNPAMAPDALFANNAANRRKGKHKHDRRALKDATKALPLAERRKCRHLAAKVNVPLTPLFRMLKQEKIFFRNTNNLKPKLAATQQHQRMLDCLERIDPLTINSRRQTLKFVEQLDEVHIDEKRFFVCSGGESCILVADEEEPPTRSVKRKSHIAKATFVSAVAKPRQLRDGSWWDGKVGAWPVGHLKRAQRASVSRPVGAAEWEAENVDQAKHKRLLLNDIIPAVMDSWPTPIARVNVQQDGAKSHLKPTDEDFNNELEALGLEGKIGLCTQPAQSPDLNINDLGFFNSLQPRRHCATPKNELELIAMVQAALEDCPIVTLKKLWATHQSVVNEITKCAGHNQFKIPHMNKDKLEKEGRLSRRLDVDPVARCCLED